MKDFFQGKDERIVDGTRYTRYLDLNKWYGIVVPKDENAYNEEFLELAKEFRNLVLKAIEVNTWVGCFF